MRLRPNSIATLAVGLLLGCQSSPETSYTQTHMLRLQCSTAVETTTRLSRLAVIDTGSAKYDYAITTGHGVPEDRPCIARDFGGRFAPVDLISFAPDYKSGTKTDWAVLRFEKIRTPDLVRYKLEPIGDDIQLNELPINFARARGLPDNQQKCQLEILDFKRRGQRVSHNCRSVPGQSGTPVTQSVNGVETLIGLHVGQLWLLETPGTGRPSRKGYINLLDTETVSQIEDIIASNL